MSFIMFGEQVRIKPLENVTWETRRAGTQYLIILLFAQIHVLLRRSAQSWLSSFSSQTAYRPMTIFWRYYDASIFTSRRDGPERSGIPVTLGPDFLKFRISKNSVFQDQETFPKIEEKSSKKISQGFAPHPFLTGLRPYHPTR